MKATRGWTLALMMLAACSDEATGPGGRLPESALAAITPTNNTACNKFWASGVNGVWTDGTKWTPAGAPTAGSSVCINAAGTYTITIQPVNPATTITVDILALDVGGAGATPTLRLGNADATVNVAEGIVVQQNALLQLNGSAISAINAVGTITNSGTIDAAAPCGGCGTAHAINADIINTSVGTLSFRSALLTLGKVGGAYENSGTVTSGVTSGLMVIPASAGNATFHQLAGVITGTSNFESFTIRSGTFTMSGGKARTRNGVSNLKPIVTIEGANLVLAPTADSAAIGVLATSTGNTTITGNVPALTTLWLGGPESLQPGTITFNDATPVNNGAIRLGSIDGGEGVLTLAGTGRLTNADTLFAPATGGSPNYHFALEVTNSGTLTLGEDMTFEKAAGSYNNTGLIAGGSTLHVVGATLVNTGTVTPTTTSAAPNFRIDAGRVMGTGNLGDVALENGATIEPGQSSGKLDIVTLNSPAGTALKIELGGTQLGTGYDQLNLASGGTMSGSLDVSEINGFLSGVCGQVFEVFTWNSTNTGFTTVNGLNPAPTRALRLFTHTATLPRKHILYGYDPTQKISVAPNPVAIAEGAAGVQYAVCLDGSPALSTGQTVTVTPTPNAQVTISPPSVTFTSTNWRDPQFFTVTAVDDNVVEGNHTGTATHASTSGVAAYNAVSIASLTANIIDNDVPPQVSSSTAVTSSVNPSTFSQSVTFTATVASNSGTPGGTVQFNIDGSDVGSPVILNGSGQAQFVISTLAVGNHTVQATYGGSSGYFGSNGALNGGQTVNPASSSTGVTSNLNPSTFGQSVTFTATVSSVVGTPTGTVQFNIDNADAGAPVALNGSGQATLTTSTLGVANHAVKATYSGATNYATSFGNLSGGQTVNQASTTTGVTSSVNPSALGQSVTFTATVSSTAGTPGGTVQFNIDNADVGGPVALSGGQATLSTSALGVGNHAVKATYGGSTNFAGGFGTLSGGQTVNAAGSSTAISSSVNPSTFGQSVTFTATVTSGAGTPAGSVQFNIDGSDVGAPVVLNGSGVAQYTTSSLATGNHAIKGTYGGSANHGGSFGTLSGGQNVSQAGSSTSVTSSLNPSTFGQSVTFTATVTSGAGTPAGTVQFNIDNANVGAPVALNGSGQATFALATLGSGNHAIKATYSGATNFASSFGTLSGGQNVNQAGSSTAVASNLNPSTFGQSVTFTATVSSGAGTPTGTVQFSIDGGNVGAPVALNGSGQATFSTSSLSAGNHTVSATYGGATNYSGGSGSLTGGQSVNQAGTTTGVASSVNPSTVGQSVTFTATVASGAGTPSGTVQFAIDGGNVGAPVALNGSGQATLSTSSLGAGNHPVSATYGGSTNYSGGAGSLAGGQNVNQPSAASTSTSVASSVNPSTVGQSVTFTATVSSGAGTPSGTVQFSIDGGNVGAPVALNGSGQASFATSSLTAGNHAVAASYGGSATHQSSNGTLSGGQNVNEPSTGTGVGQPGIDISEVVISEAFKSGPDQNIARGTLTILNSSSGPATVVTLGTVTMTFRSNKPAGVKTNHTATCTFAPTNPTNDVLGVQQAKTYSFDCTVITPSLQSSATDLTATVTVVNVSNQVGQVRVRTWTKNSLPYKLP